MILDTALVEIVTYQQIEEKYFINFVQNDWQNLRKRVIYQQPKQTEAIQSKFHPIERMRNK